MPRRPNKREAQQADIDLQVQCLGVSGYTRSCVHAIEAILDSNELPQKATIVTLVPGRRNLQEQHLFLFWNWCGVPLTIVRNGFASGYPGEGPRGFSLAICMVRSKDIPIEEFTATEHEFRLLDEGRMDRNLYQKVRQESELLTWPWPPWVLEEHEKLLEAGKIWRNLGWQRKKDDDVTEALESLDNYHPLVGRKLKLAMVQLENSSEIEEWQQTGILVRDAWIEFAQKLTANKRIDDQLDIGPNYVKAMLRILPLGDEALKLACSVVDLALKIQHDRDLFSTVARWCVLMTILSMGMLLTILEQQGAASELKYYKCPICGSMKLSIVTKGVTDFDGYPIPMKYLECTKCGWSIEETGLATQPFS